MPEINASSIEDVFLGTQMVSALIYGEEEIYVRFNTYSFGTPGDFSLTLPDWVTGYGAVLSGGGGGGVCGNGGNGAHGYGGKGGEIRATWGRMGSSSNKVLTGKVGVGGAGGTGIDSIYGKPGGDTTLIGHTSTVYTAAGGTSNPSSGMHNGGRTTGTFGDPYFKYFNMPEGMVYPNGPGGIASGGAGTRGGGGAGGKGGYFNSYSYGGKGGSGFVDIYVWGWPRH